MLCSSATPARAYELALILLTPITGVSIGDIVSFDVFLDTEGESGITLISVGMTFDPSVVRYRPDFSDANDYYPLYAPAAGKGTGTFASWLEPASDPPSEWGGLPPAIGGQVNVEFYEVNLRETVATATNLWLARLSFEAIGPGVSLGQWGFGNGGHVFRVDGVDVASSVTVTGDATMLPLLVPEPATALLVGLGLFGLGATARRRR